MQFLDYSGLSYFWTKLKAAFARVVHVHASSDVTRMTGYSKPSSGSAIATSDSLNGAIGKLEAKVDTYNDSDYVHKTGNEDISGIKKFIWGLVGVKTNVDISNGIYTDDHYLYYTYYDQNNVQCGRFILIYNKNDYRFVMMSIGKKQETFDESTSFTLSIDTSNNYARATLGSNIKCLRPSANGTTLGENSDTHRWGQIYSTSSTISTSDERKKQDITSVPSNILDAWEEVDWFQFKLIDSVNEKGDKARIHNGLVAQRIKNIFDKYNLDISKYGLFCYDEWESEDPVFNEYGGEISPGHKAGSLYSIRYEEALCMEAACQRRENARLKKRIADLEERLAALELKVS